MRLRTLPLSLSGIVIGVCLASEQATFLPRTVIFLVLSTVSLQILSNLSNELGDCIQGTDNRKERLGKHYSIMDGKMTKTEMRRLIAATVVCSCVFGLLMIRFSFGTFFSIQALSFIALGACAIVAAMKYTLGSKPYGYRGLGDIFVFIFFGLATVLGSGYICSHNLSLLYESILPACAIGCFSVGVLNVNNIRDMRTDIKTRVTTAIRLGERKAKIYQIVIVSLGWLFLAIYSLLNGGPWYYFITTPLFALHLVGVWKRTGEALDPMLPMLVMSTCATAIFFGLAILL